MSESANKRKDQQRTVLFVESAAAMGGVQFSTLYLAQRLNRSDWRSIVVVPEEGDLTRACHEVKIETCEAGKTNLWSTSVRIGSKVRLPNPAAWIWNAFAIMAAARRLKRVLKSVGPDLVVTKGLAAHFWGGWAARRLGIPSVWHVQDFISERNFGIYRRIFGRVAGWLPNQIIVDGLSIKEQLPVCVHSRTSVVLNGVDTNEFRPGVDRESARRELGISSDQLVIGHLGRMTPWKGQHHLIEAFAHIADKHSNAMLLLVGSPVFDNDGFQRRLLDLVEQFGLQTRVKFAGYRHDTARVLSAMDVFAFTSIEKDTSPLALLSAMSCGLPIVAFDIAGVRELIATEDQFQVVPVGQVNALAHALSTLISNEISRKRLGESARTQAIAELNLDKYTARVEQVFRTALQVNPTPLPAVGEVRESAAV